MLESSVVMRKRDRLKNKLGFGRSASPNNLQNPSAEPSKSPPSPADPLAPPPSFGGTALTAPTTTHSRDVSAAPLTTSRRDLWLDALKSLSEEEQLAIQKIRLTCHTHSALSARIEELLSITKARQEECEKESYVFHFQGNEIILRDIVAKIVFWLDKFKTVGDVAANFDPVHASLPWAGFRFLLQVMTTLFLQRTLLSSIKGGCGRA